MSGFFGRVAGALGSSELSPKLIVFKPAVAAVIWAATCSSVAANAAARLRMLAANAWACAYRADRVISRDRLSLGGVPGFGCGSASACFCRSPDCLDFVAPKGVSLGVSRKLEVNKLRLRHGRPPRLKEVSTMSRDSCQLCREITQPARPEKQQVEAIRRVAATRNQGPHAGIHSNRYSNPVIVRALTGVHR